MGIDAYDIDGNPLSTQGEVNAAFAKDRHVCHDKIPTERHGEIVISTVHLVYDHNYVHGGKPLIFETMIFGGPSDQYTERYHTRAEAEEGHRTVLRRVHLELAKEQLAELAGEDAVSDIDIDDLAQFPYTL